LFSILGLCHHQVYFNQGDAAQKELDKDIERSLRIVFRSSRIVDRVSGVFFKDGKSLLGAANPERSDMLSEEEFKYYVKVFNKQKFGPGLNYYRTGELNWRDELQFVNVRHINQSSYSAVNYSLCQFTPQRPTSMLIKAPVLMITAGLDFILTPDLTKGMENSVVSLTREHIPNAGHWLHMEQAATVNQCLLRWLDTVVGRNQTKARL